jgi:hypothetical protein
MKLKELYMDNPVTALSEADYEEYTVAVNKSLVISLY